MPTKTARSRGWRAAPAWTPRKSSRAPTFFVGDEMFLANDRLHFVGAALERG
jgi:2-hydroxychromene-2-carboxylate isomerase